MRGQEHVVSESGQSEDETEEILVVVDQENDSGDSLSDWGIVLYILKNWVNIYVHARFVNIV